MNAIFKFADFELDRRSGELRRGGDPIPVQQQVLEILAVLVAAAGELVTRDELRERIWGPHTHVDFDRAINKAVNRLRQIFGDDAARPRFIETLPKRGYRFVASVSQLPARKEIPQEAREAYLKARHFWNKRTPDDLRRSVVYFHRAIEQDPDHAPAWTGLANAYIMIGLFGLDDPRNVLPQAKAAAERALRLNDSLAEAHTVLAETQKLHEWDWEASEHSYQRAIAIEPGCAVAHHWYAQLLSMLGRHEEAQHEIETARRCEPLSATIVAFASYVAFEARQFETAVTKACEALELDAHAPVTHFLLGRAYAKLGRTSSAIAALEKALGAAGWFPQAEAALGYVHARGGDRTRAEAILEALRTRRLTQYVSPIDVAQVSLGLGDSDGAITALEEGYRSRAVRMVVIGDPFFAELAPDTRYRDLLTRLRLPLST